MHYAELFREDSMKSETLLCVHILIHPFPYEAVLLHVRVVGAPQVVAHLEEITSFTRVEIIGLCDESCQGEHPGKIEDSMMALSPELAEALRSLPEYETILAAS